MQRATTSALTAAGLVAGVALLLGLNAADQADKTKADEEKKQFADLKKATVDGKYQMLLRQIKVPDDKDSYGDFNDYGLFGGNSYAGFDDLPKGYWVYVAPYWYIWRDQSAEAAQRPKRAWGPEQATGKPDTDMAGDIQTAWASATPDGQEEWLMLEYAEPVLVKEVHVYETYNPGALTRVTAFKADGSEVEIWKGKDPSAGKDIGISVLEVKKPLYSARIKLYLDSPNVPGWNEIDAVGIKDGQGKMSWAVAAEASSTFAQPQQVPERDAERRIRQLEREVRDLKAQIKRLEDMLDKKDK